MNRSLIEEVCTVFPKPNTWFAPKVLVFVLLVVGKGPNCSNLDDPTEAADFAAITIVIAGFPTREDGIGPLNRALIFPVEVPKREHSYRQFECKRVGGY